MTVPAVKLRPELIGRKARCRCGKEEESTWTLPFFQFQGEGSQDATRVCGECGYFDIGHAPDLTKVRGPCESFRPRGPLAVDKFYCGCNGWD